MTIPPTSDSYLELRTYSGDVNRNAINGLIAEIWAAKPYTSFHFFLGRILENLQKQNQTLAFQDHATIPELAWAGRNAMELRVLARYGCRSVSNLRRFQADALVNGSNILQALIRISNDLAKQVGAKKRVPVSVHRGHAGIQALRMQAGLGREPPLMARTCAKSVGMESEYLVFGSMTSPLVHPSAVTVLESFDLESCRVWLVLLSLKLVTDVIVDVRDHLGKYGCRPAIGKMPPLSET